ncbi:hypothetical protein FDECE_15955 [Fusarium decemcellulare]|nr:hypothetical protein FDECE_15955 [Fusarium decemcellulare]
MSASSMWWCAVRSDTSGKDSLPVVCLFVVNSNAEATIGRPEQRRKKKSRGDDPSEEGLAVDWTMAMATNPPDKLRYDEVSDSKISR